MLCFPVDLTFLTKTVNSSFILFYFFFFLRQQVFFQSPLFLGDIRSWEPGICTNHLHRVDKAANKGCLVLSSKFSYFQKGKGACYKVNLVKHNPKLWPKNARGIFGNFRNVLGNLRLWSRNWIIFGNPAIKKLPSTQS